MNMSAQKLEQNLIITEEWRPIVGYEGLYEVSNLGRIKSLPRWRKNRQNGYFIKEAIINGKNNKGYRSLDFPDKTVKRSRMVAITWIPNPDNLPFVNHINGIKSDDRVENLEWCTPGDNERHAYRTGLKKAAYLGKRGKLHNQSKPVLAINDTSILEFESKTACGEYFGVTVQNVFRALKFNGVCRGHKIYAL